MSLLDLIRVTFHLISKSFKALRGAHVLRAKQWAAKGSKVTSDNKHNITLPLFFKVAGSEERRRTLTPLALRERYSALNEPGVGESFTA